jgi:hypothetical protein
MKNFSPQVTRTLYNGKAGVMMSTIATQRGCDKDNMCTLKLAACSLMKLANRNQSHVLSAACDRLSPVNHTALEQLQSKHSGSFGGNMSSPVE